MYSCNNETLCVIQVALPDASSRHNYRRAVNYTIERRHVRCFETLAMCSIWANWHWMGRCDMNTGWWDMNKGFDHPNWSAAQAFVSYYKALAKLPEVGALSHLLACNK